MADPRGINPQASYANRYSVMVSDVVRLVFMDERQNQGRVAATETIVGEIVLSRDHALAMANEIIQILTSAPAAKPVSENGPFQPRRTVQQPV